MSVTKKQRAVKDLTGQRFGLWTVLGRGENIGDCAGWVCRCDCGTERPVSAGNLKSGGSRCCGCLQSKTQRERSAPGESGFNALYARYRNSAANRKKEWHLSKPQFRELTSQDCFYCGSPPAQVCHAGDSKKLTPETRRHGAYTYNGIDRRDNDVGYVSDNCVPCCKTCNFAKFTMSEADFRDWFAKRDHMSREDIEELVSTMRKHGVANFKLDGLEVTFAPTVYSAGDSDTDLDPFVAAEKVKSAVEQFKKINDEDRLNLEWSV